MSVKPQAVKLILFDLGGVLVELDDIAKMWGERAKGLGSKELWERWLKHSGIQAIDRGKISVDDFLKQWMADWEIDQPFDELKNIYEGLIKNPYPGALQLLADCQKKYSLACLSNMTEGHWPKVKSFGLTDYFEQVWVSYQMGFCKPEKTIYEMVLKECPFEAPEILFLDDNELNVNAAKEWGIQAVEVKTALGARQKLQNLGLL